VTFPDSNRTHQANGQTLAMAYCQSCHLYPEPALLPKAIWQRNVLPNMAMRMGVSSQSLNAYMGLSHNEIKNLIINNVYASQPYITQRDWTKIVEYYLAEAPHTTLPQEPKAEVSKQLLKFATWIPGYDSTQPPVTTMVKFHSARKQLYIADRANNLNTYNQDLQLVGSEKLNSPISDIVITDGEISLLTMGFMDPSDEYSGQLLVKPETGKTFQVMASQLPRPVQMTVADMNNDQKNDWIISGFGNQTGRLSWFEKGNDTSFMEHVIKPVPGTLKTVLHDFDKDGKQDVIALFAQGNEQISIFYNRGNGKLEEKVVLRFTPVHGSSYFELTDFNKDGAPDILYTNGDNADLSFSLKKYHGVRIFMNDGKNNFSEKWFYPMFGASKALAKDFDKDGDIDIAAISFFPDFDNTPHESFIYFENKGNFVFESFTTESAELGRWLVMDAGDVDSDGDEDIILGSFSLSPTPVPGYIKKVWQKGPPFIILRNTHE
jgi:hypothetical protein